jgi:ATP-dependent Lon protease
MRPEECRITPDGVEAVIDLYRDRPGCRDLEQSAEHLAGHALYEIETQGVREVEFDGNRVRALLRG